MGIWLDNSMYEFVEKNHIEYNDLHGIYGLQGSHGPYRTNIFNNIIDFNLAIDDKNGNDKYKLGGLQSSSGG